MRVLITGACGFVGSTLARGLLESRHNVEIWGIDNFIREGSRSNAAPLTALGVKIIEGDIRRPVDLARLPRVDWVLDCAAEPGVLAGVDGRMSSFDLMDHNLIGTIQVLEFCKQHRAGLILLSTSRVYSIPPLAGLPVEVIDEAYRPVRYAPEIGLTEAGISELFPTNPPQSLYGVSKRCAELLALEYSEAYRFPVWINRCGVLAGKGQFGKADQGIFSFWIQSWKQGRSLSYIGFDGSGSQVRDCLHPQDLMPVVLKQMEGAPPVLQADGIDPRICNFGGGQENAMSLAQLSRWCTEKLGPKSIGSIATPRPYDLPWVVIDASRAARMWHWQPITSVDEILNEILASSTPENRGSPTTLLNALAEGGSSDSRRGTTRLPE